jgi:hypothetical protein
MAPTAKAPVEDVVDPRAAPRQSLLEVTYAKLDAKGVGSRGVNDLPARVVLLCENSARLESAETYGTFWTSLFAAAAVAPANRGGASKKHVPWTYTGATVVYPDSTLAVLESTGGGIIAVLRELERKSLGRDGVEDAVAKEIGMTNLPETFPFASVRVVSSVEDAARAFPGWHVGFCRALALEEYEPADASRLLEIASEANVACVELGYALGEVWNDPGSVTRKLGELRGMEPEDPFPTQGQLMGVLRNPEGPPTLSEFLDIYDAALDVDLDSENVWPAPPPLRF